MEEKDVSSVSDVWDDIDLSDLTPTESEADQPNEEEGEAPEETKGPETPAEEEPAPQEELFELKNMNEVRKVTRAEITELAQKGLNWEHVKSERDTASAKANRYEAFLKALSDGKDIEEFMDSVSARQLAQKEGIDESVALQKVQLQREREAFEAEKKAREPRENPEETARKKMFQTFRETYQGVKADDIPNEVWAEVNKGADLTLAYTMNQNKQLQAKVKALENNEKNSGRSTGSMKTAGQSKKDEFDALWNDGT